MKYLLLLFLGTLTTSSCQDYGSLSFTHSLPKTLKEISGITIARDSSLIWAVNDSGNKAIIYGYQPGSNSIVKTISVDNGFNRDWEDITTDGESTLYVGDFGNNQNYRKDLVIYTVTIPDSIAHSKVDASKTTFELEDQKKFPPKKKHRNFDIEAFVYSEGLFYLFTRNRSSKFDGTTKMYRLPAQPGHYTAKLIDTFQTCKDYDDCQVTGASLDRQNGKLALLSYNKVWIFSEYENDEFFSATVEEIKLKHTSQKESITFKGSNTLFIADERSHMQGGNLYILRLK
ncbi:MAG: hypothetical protein KJO05_10465 [Bacteroidia bacterium]|nr:hypothetical protein [Bacteroidia bacterium]NNF30512.1 hypothetical protein [Flavobacteriaceae bacterium]MBT8276510.1 hypothetical protein [Bacteroidia bacterium]NNJ82231.1 hypothetical protein [Flavobacteriaceae bacterium]NNK53840.1 hypothetical protein [Flavobacteriaceae bacterium]